MLGAPTTLSDLSSPETKALAQRVSDGGKPERFNRQSPIEQVYRTFRAIRDRVPAHIDPNTGAEVPSSGLILPKAAEDYLRSNNMVGPDVAMNHFNNVRGRNDWKAVKFFMTAGRAQPKVNAVEAMAEARAAFSPRRPRLQLTGSFVELERALRVRDGAGYAGVPFHTREHPDPFCQEIQRQIVQAEVEQTAERTRGMHRKPGSEFLSIHLDGVLADTTYDAVIDWSALAVDERGAMLHGRGFVPDRPVDLVKVGRAVLGDKESGGLFTSRKQAQDVVGASATDDEVEADTTVANASRNGGNGVGEGDTIGEFRRSGLQVQPTIPLPRLFDFSMRNVRFGSPQSHALLRLPKAVLARVTVAKCQPACALLDPDRVASVADVSRLLPRAVTGVEVIEHEQVPPEPTVNYTSTDAAPAEDDDLNLTAEIQAQLQRNFEECMARVENDQPNTVETVQ